MLSEYGLSEGSRKLWGQSKEQMELSRERMLCSGSDCEKVEDKVKFDFSQ